MDSSASAASGNQWAAWKTAERPASLLNRPFPAPETPRPVEQVHLARESP